MSRKMDIGGKGRKRSRNGLLLVLGQLLLPCAYPHPGST